MEREGKRSPEGIWYFSKVYARKVDDHRWIRIAFKKSLQRRTVCGGITFDICAYGLAVARSTCSICKRIGSAVRFPRLVQSVELVQKRSLQEVEITWHG